MTNAIIRVFALIPAEIRKHNLPWISFNVILSKFYDLEEDFFFLFLLFGVVCCCISRCTNACCVLDYRTSVSTGNGVHTHRRYPARSRGHFFTSDAAITHSYPVSNEAPRGLDASVPQSCLPVVLKQLESFKIQLRFQLTKICEQ